MEPISIALYAVLTIVLIIYVISPLFGSDRDSDKAADGAVKGAAAAESEADIKKRIAVVYNTLKDLEFEYSTGKLSEEEYEESMARYRELGTELNARLSDQDSRPGVEADSSTLTDDLEDAVRARRKRRAAGNKAAEENNIPLKSRA